MKGLIEKMKTQALAESAIKIAKLENLLNFEKLDSAFWKKQSTIEKARADRLQYTIDVMKNGL